MPAIDAPVRRVTVYPDRALVTREGAVDLDPGEHELVVSGLPQLLRESLRASLRGPAGTRLLDVDLGTAYHSRAPEPEIAALEESLERLRKEKALLDARAAALSERRKWLGGIGESSKDFARGLAQGSMKPPDLDDFFRFMSDQALHDAEEELGLGADRQRVQREIEAAERELERRRGGGIPDRMEARVTVALESAGRCELEVGYIVLDASWHPAYEIRVEQDGKQDPDSIELTSVGIVRQRSGEGWSGVALALSTARPSAAAALPKLDPWYLRAPRAVEPQLAVAHRMAMPAPGSAPLEEAAVDMAEIDQSGPSAVFRVPRPVDVEADGTPHKTTIEQLALSATVDRVTAPALDTQAHLHAKVTNDTGHVLLAGDASVFHGGDFVGTVRLDQTAPGATFDAYLGLDDEIEVKRELTERNVDRGSLLQSGIRRTTYGYWITVRNRASAARRVEVRDRLPISQHEQVKVRVHDLVPEPTERAPLEALVWRFSLEPGTEHHITTRFTVEQPADLDVIGLP